MSNRNSSKFAVKYRLKLEDLKEAKRYVKEKYPSFDEFSVEHKTKLATEALNKVINSRK